MSAELFDELKAAMKARNVAEDDVSTARARVSEARTVLREKTELLDRATRALREIESEVLTGVSALPLVAAGQRNGVSRGGVKTGDDDEDDTGRRLRPGVSEMPGAKPAAVETRPDGGSEKIGWTSAELDAALWEALGWVGARGRLIYRPKPATNDEILAELANCWRGVTAKQTAANVAARKVYPHLVRGGKSPAFWMGTDASRPPLEGAALAYRVSRVLELRGAMPRDPVPDDGRPANVMRDGAVPAEPAAAEPDRPKRKRKEAAGASTTP